VHAQDRLADIVEAHAEDDVATQQRRVGRAFHQPGHEELREQVGAGRRRRQQALAVAFEGAAGERPENHVAVEVVQHEFVEPVQVEVEALGRHGQAAVTQTECRGRVDQAARPVAEQRDVLPEREQVDVRERVAVQVRDEQVDHVNVRQFLPDGIEHAVAAVDRHVHGTIGRQ
jgi:hypothetical protein